MDTSNNVYGMHSAWHIAVIKKCQACLQYQIVNIFTVNVQFLNWCIGHKVAAVTLTFNKQVFAQNDLLAVVFTRMALLIAMRFSEFPKIDCRNRQSLRE